MPHRWLRQERRPLLQITLREIGCCQRHINSIPIHSCLRIIFIQFYLSSQQKHKHIRVPFRLRRCYSHISNNTCHQDKTLVLERQPPDVPVDPTDNFECWLRWCSGKPTPLSIKPYCMRTGCVQAKGRFYRPNSDPANYDNGGLITITTTVSA